MNKIGKIVSIVLVTGLAILGIYSAYGFKMLMSIGYAITKYRIRKLGLDGSLGIDLGLRVCNPSILAVDITGYNLDVYLNDKKVSTISSTTPVKILENGQTIITIPIDVNIKSLFGVVGSKELINNFAAQNYSQIIITLQGQFDGAVIGVPVHVKVTPKLATFTLEDIRTSMNAPDTSTPCK